MSAGPGGARRRLLAVGFYLLAAALAAVTVISAVRASAAYEALSRYETPEEKTDTLLRDWVSTLSFGLYRGARDKSNSVAALVRSAERETRRSRNFGLALLTLCTAFLAWSAVHARRARPPSALVLHLLGVAGVFLVVGLVAPILTISAHGEVVLIGEVVLQHETKGILSTISALAGTGNYLVAVLLSLFSVALPIAKLVMSIAVLVVPHRGVRRRSLRTVDLIGKWSMADVFVVAILLAFLAANTEQVTRATLGTGLYFFAGYGVLSLLAGHLMVRHEADLVAD